MLIAVAQKSNIPRNRVSSVLSGARCKYNSCTQGVVGLFLALKDTHSKAQPYPIG